MEPPLIMSTGLRGLQFLHQSQESPALQVHSAREACRRNGQRKDLRQLAEHGMTHRERPRDELTKRLATDLADYASPMPVILPRRWRAPAAR
jgi:hypothetical protein